jgi:hypothetical protein
MGNMQRNFISERGHFVITDVKPVNELKGTMVMATLVNERSSQRCNVSENNARLL